MEGTMAKELDFEDDAEEESGVDDIFFEHSDVQKLNSWKIKHSFLRC